MKGIQAPSKERGHKANNKNGRLVTDLLSIFGEDLDLWQEHVNSNALATQPDDKWLHDIVLVSVPRQAGKTKILEARALAGVLLFNEKTVIVCAHEVRTTLEIFNRLATYFDTIPEFNNMLQRTVRRAGDESIILKNGCRIKFISRSRNAGRGFSADCLLLDEAQELPDMAWDALMPTLNARPNPQVWLFGTPPGPRDNGEVFTRLRNAALGGKSPNTYLAEWSAEPEDDFDDEATWAKANPALNIRIPSSVLSSARASMSDESFGREFLGIWGRKTSKSVIDPLIWQARARALDLDELSPKWLSVDVSPDRSMASVAAAEKTDDGYAVMVVEALPGVSWVPDFIASRMESRNIQGVAIDAGGPAGSLIDALEDRGVPVKRMQTNDIKAACGGFFDAVMAEQLIHFGDPRLNSAVGGANKRAIGDAWGWNKKNDSVDITPLVAVTNALWLVDKEVQPLTKTVDRRKVSNTFYSFS